MLKIKNPLHAHFGHLRSLLSKRWVKFSLLGILGVFLLANLVVFAMYRQRFYPNSGLSGKQVGGQSYRQVEQQPLLAKTFSFKTSYAQKTVSTSELGAQVDWPATTKAVQGSKRWLPVANLFGYHTYDLRFSYSQKNLEQAIASLATYFERPSTDWSIDTSGAQAKLVRGKDGVRVDQAKLKTRFYQGINNGYVQVPTVAVAPKVSDKTLQPLVDQLTAKQQVSLSYTYNGTAKKPSAQDILSWYDISGTTLTLNKQRVSSYLSGVGTGLGIRVQNLTQLVTDTATALDKRTKLAATITAAPKAVKTYTFCVRTKNVSDSELAGFASKIASSLNDARGWSLDGQVSFSQVGVGSGCSMNFWLSAAADLPSFGAICDSTWSCTVRPNVIINYDRWVGASDAWNASGGSLDDYRSMVINHESGHWLGFGHRYCGGAGQQAPVMQQQSISLQGCTFNPWPSTAEKNTLKAQLGL